MIRIYFVGGVFTFQKTNSIEDHMAGKIFYRERVKSKEGQMNPRFRVVAASDIDLKIYADHFRRKELEQLAKETKAKLVELKRDKKSKSRK